MYASLARLRRGARERARLNYAIVTHYPARTVVQPRILGSSFARDRARKVAVDRISRVLRRWMEQQGLTSTRGVADQIGISWKPIDKLLKGDADPPLSTLLHLVHALDLRSIEELLGPFETATVVEAGRRGPDGNA